MSKKRFANGGAGYGSPRPTQKSKVRYGLLVINPENADKDQLVINIKMINDQVCASRSCRHSSEDFMKAISDFADNPNIRWDRPTSKDEFIQTAKNTWFRKIA